MNYFTPIKDSNLVNKIHKTTTQTREGDWICLNCNNLNFSFRKKCNRCKTQTREQNDMTETYDYYYYPAKNYLYVPNSNTLKNSHHTATSDSKDLPLCHTPIFTQNNKQNKTPEKTFKELPSVSPLVKKYNMREMKSESSGGSSSKGSVWGVAVRDFQDTLGVSGRSEQSGREQQQCGSDQLQRMINNIIL